MALTRLTKITGPGVSTDTNWVGNNANFTGITTTLTSFNIGVTTFHSTLAEVHNIKSTGIITATGGSFSGNVTAVDGTFTGNVSIAGTLTYEDVTNIDSVGIITAPAVDVDDFLDVGSNIKLGNAGVITATSFVGNGAALTGIDATAIKDSGGNVKVQAQASGAVYTGIHTFNSDLDVDGHTNLDNVSIAGVSTFSNDLLITNNSPVLRLTESDTSTASRLVVSAGQLYIQAGANGGGASTGNGNIYLTGYNAQETYAIFNGNGAVQLYHNNIKKFDTTTSGIDVTGTTNTDNLYVTGAATIKASATDTDVFNIIRSDHSSTKLLRIFQDSSSGGGAGGCHINTVNRHLMITANTNANADDGIYLKTSGEVGIGTDNPNQELTIYGDEPNIRLTHTGSTNKFNALYTHVDGTGVEFNSYQDGTGTKRPFIFKQYTSETLRIFSNGNVGVGDYSSTNLTHALQALRTSGSTYVSSKNTGGNALFYAEASNGNTAKLELMQAGVGNFTLEVGGTNALMFKDDGTERLRITSAGQLVMGATFSKAKFEIKDSGYSSSSVLQRISGDDANPYALIIANDTCNTAAASGLQFFVSDGGEHYVRARASSTAGNNNLRLIAQNNVSLYSGSSETERLRIASNGAIGLGGANYGSSGQVLTSGGSGSAVSWTTVSGTTINNNANNRVITGSGTANTLEGESQFTYDGTSVKNLCSESYTAVTAEFRNTTSIWGGGVRFKSNNAYGTIEIMNNAGTYGAGLFNSTGGWHWDNNMQFHGSVTPWTNGNLNLGSSSKRWANVYTTDLQLSNEGKTNDVDGTWGDWTLQEGENDVFMINNRTGKKFAITMREVS